MPVTGLRFILRAVSYTHLDVYKRQHQESGLIADFGQPEELAECYLTYLHYPEWIESYGNAAMAVIQERFDSRRVSQQVTEVYYDILQ